jgi:hypothetical protein
LRAAEGKVRRSGKALPQKLTTHQQQIMQRLVQAHGDNVEVMICYVISCVADQC